MAVTAEPEPMKIFQEFLQASIDATTSQKQLVQEERKVRKNAKQLAATNQKAYIAKIRWRIRLRRRYEKILHRIYLRDRTERIFTPRKQ